jgi:hypothetical protein
MLALRDKSEISGKLALDEKGGLMSVCDEGWVAGWCPAFHWAKDTPDPYCAMHPAQVFRINQEPPDSCPFAAILKALPTASEDDLYKLKKWATTYDVWLSVNPKCCNYCKHQELLDEPDENGSDERCKLDNLPFGLGILGRDFMCDEWDVQTAKERGSDETEI